MGGVSFCFIGVENTHITIEDLSKFEPEWVPDIYHTYQENTPPYCISGFLGGEHIAIPYYKGHTEKDIEPFAKLCRRVARAKNNRRLKKLLRNSKYIRLVA